ncbi:uncharacterized protein F5891DRAFT_977104 [Suillus fuscotomentosus]|uniref:Uncharacterized protein n=1 Tax=Suillus fuscotomentosus TaxID=1912939 RepID=A0AAD4EDF1_9AGAM|nr:uncharacterized protein F5891DRAFT_977104 [Suillus fuscotomentosus]KAG1904225.1 hypothetical protein F5891DRAFT_977104 [Suillus fuscotomentosus]
MSESTPLVRLNIHNNILTSVTAPSRCPRCYGSHATSYLCLRAVKIGNHDRALAELYDVAEAIGSMTIEDTDLEANLLMELTRARREVFRAKKLLADCVVREHEVMATLSKFKSSISEHKLDKADIGLGCMWITFKKHSLSHHASLHSSHIKSQAASQNITIKLD